MRFLRYCWTSASIALAGLLKAARRSMRDVRSSRSGKVPPRLPSALWALGRRTSHGCSAVCCRLPACRKAGGASLRVVAATIAAACARTPWGPATSGRHPMPPGAAARRCELAAHRLAQVRSQRCCGRTPQAARPWLPAQLGPPSYRASPLTPCLRWLDRWLLVMGCGSVTSRRACWRPWAFG